VAKIHGIKKKEDAGSLPKMSYGHTRRETTSMKWIDTTGEPYAGKLARTVRRGVDGKGPEMAPRQQPTLHLDEAHRIVDAPVDRTPVSANSNGASQANGSMAVRANGNANVNGNGAPRDENAEGSVTEQQVASIRKLCQHLGKSEPDNVTSISFLVAKRLIQQLTAEYKESRQQSSKAS